MNDNPNEETCEGCVYYVGARCGHEKNAIGSLTPIDSSPRAARPKRNPWDRCGEFRGNLTHRHVQLMQQLVSKIK